MLHSTLRWEPATIPYHKQSTRNLFELRWTFCPANRQSFAGHLTVKYGVNINIFPGHFEVLDLHLPDILSGEAKPFAGHFLGMSGESGEFRVREHSVVTTWGVGKLDAISLLKIEYAHIM